LQKIPDPWLGVENIIRLEARFQRRLSYPTVPSPAGPCGLGYRDVTPSALKKVKLQNREAVRDQ